MAELGIDIMDQTPTKLTWDAAKASDVIVTTGCGDACPVFPGKRYEDWTLDHPAGLDVEAVRPIRDDIAAGPSDWLSNCYRAADCSEHTAIVDLPITSTRQQSATGQAERGAFTVACG